MGDLIKCPIDGTSLVMMPEEGVVQTTCHECHRSYRLTRGKLVSADTARESENPHEVSVELVVRAGEEVVPMHDTIFSTRWTGLREGSRVTTVEQLGPQDSFQIVRVRPHGEAARLLREPGDRAAIRTVGLSIRGALVTIFALVLLMYFYHWAFVFLILPGAAITTIIAVIAWKRRTTRQRVGSVELERLEREQWLLGKLEHYRLEAEEVEGRLARYDQQIGELRQLDQKMAAADGDFEHRRDVVGRGIQTLEHHVQNDKKLRDAIEDAIDMVEIEYRASRVLGHLPDEALDRLSTTISELDAIETENQQLEAELEANAEVNAIAPG